MENIINIVDFSDVIGGRIGNKSAYEFFRWFKPKFDENLKDNKKTILNLDKTYGITAPFADEFSVLMLDAYSYDTIVQNLTIESNDSEYLKSKFIRFLTLHKKTEQ